MRQRVEDLGRLAVMLEKIMDMDIWFLYEGRPKDIWDDFQEMDEDKQEELLEKFAIGLRDMKIEMENCVCIAQGTDELNEDDE